MQDRYAGDIGDYAKLALLRTLSAGRTLGVAWYRYPGEDHNKDGRHTAYLEQPERWRHLDRELYDALASIVLKERSISALEQCLGTQIAFAPEVIATSDLPPGARGDARRRWFGRTLDTLRPCDIVFADPDNGLVRRHRTPQTTEEVRQADAAVGSAGTRRRANRRHLSSQYATEGWSRCRGRPLARPTRRGCFRCKSHRL